MSLFKETYDFFRFFFKTQAEDKKIVFYAEHGDYYPNFEGLINEILKETELTICYISSDIDDPIFETTENRINPFYINYWLTWLFVFIDCKVFIMTMTDLEQFHLKRSSNSVHYLYLFHAMASIHMMYRKGAFDHYDSILCVGPYQIEEFRRDEELYEKRAKFLVQGGYYRLERIHYNYQRYKRTVKSSSGKKTILIAPSWGEKNVIEAYGEYLSGLFLENGFKVIVRPHPETVKRNGSLLDKIEEQFRDNGDFLLERSVATDDSLFRADVLICDCSGVAIEYTLGTERPVLFVDCPLKIRNPDFEELEMEPFELMLRQQTGILLKTDELDQILKSVNKLLLDKDAYREKIQNFRQQNIYNFGQTSRVAAQHVIALIENKPEQSA
ncbi:CDP-glycerol glycerophosphotransferase family protein [Candidatus Riflebacteria bacterium]